jgi:hypothetical protein
MAKPNAKNFNSPSQPSAPPVPTPIPSDVQWTCEIRTLNADGTMGGGLTKPLTVGEKFLLACEGPSIDSLDLQKQGLELEIPKDQRYDMRLLQIRELGSARGEFIATSWKIGQHKLDNPILTDGRKRLGLGTVDLPIGTVIDEQKNPEHKPFPPIDPVALAWPLWVWLILLVLVGAIVGATVWQWRRVARRRRFLKLLEQNQVASKPYFHFNKELRRLQRQLPHADSEWSQGDAGVTREIFFRELDSALRWYIARVYLLPSFQEKPRELLRDLKRMHRDDYPEIRRDLAVALDELEKAGRRPLSLRDAQQIVELTRSAADHIFKLRET